MVPVCYHINSLSIRAFLSKWPLTLLRNLSFSLLSNRIIKFRSNESGCRLWLLVFESFNISRKSIESVCGRFEMDLFIIDKLRSGRPHMFNKDYINELINPIKKGGLCKLFFYKELFINCIFIDKIMFHSSLSRPVSNYAAH